GGKQPTPAPGAAVCGVWPASLNALSPECTRLCLTRSDAWMKPLPHTWHGKGRSPVCTRRCRRSSATPCSLRCLASVSGCRNLLPHWGHQNALSPECTRLCLTRSEAWMKPLPQTWHRKGRSPLPPSVMYWVWEPDDVPRRS
uniref:Uncharacterized protein n=1 Tax=Callorhinchus milii TaxID=7868 RepID=A0A4W3I8Z2_CALMI